jgi:hypothetical protein
MRVRHRHQDGGKIVEEANKGAAEAFMTMGKVTIGGVAAKGAAGGVADTRAIGDVSKSYESCAALAACFVTCSEM